MSDSISDPSSPEAMVNEGGGVTSPPHNHPDTTALKERAEAMYQLKRQQAIDTCKTHPFLVLFLALSVGVLAGASIPVERRY